MKNLIIELRLLVVALLIRCIVLIVPADTQRGRDIIVALGKRAEVQSAPDGYIGGRECHKEEL